MKNRLIQLLGSLLAKCINRPSIFCTFLSIYSAVFGRETNVRRAEIANWQRPVRVNYMICHFSCLQVHLAGVPMRTQRTNVCTFCVLFGNANCCWCCIGICTHNQFHCTRFSFFFVALYAHSIPNRWTDEMENM